MTPTERHLQTALAAALEENGRALDLIEQLRNGMDINNELLKQINVRGNFRGVYTKVIEVNDALIKFSRTALSPQPQKGKT